MIKSGQIYKDPIGNEYLVVATGKLMWNDGMEVTFKSLQTNAYYNIGELIPTTADFIEQESLQLSDKKFTDKDVLEVDIQELKIHINWCDTQMKHIQYQKQQYENVLQQKQKELENLNNDN